MNDTPKPGLRQILSTPRLGAVLVMGMASGLPYNLTESTMQAVLGPMQVRIAKVPGGGGSTQR